MRLRFKGEDVSVMLGSGWYIDGHFFIKYYSNKMNIVVKREITNYVDEEMKVYFKTLDLLHDSIWALSYSLVYKDDYFDIDIDSIH